MKGFQGKKILALFSLLGAVCLLVFALTPDSKAEEEAGSTIEELTNGKIKVGDLITKENVDIVKDHLAVGIYECVQQGMIMEMDKNVAPWESVPKWYRELTRKNHEMYGDPVVDENAVIHTKDGDPWPGGTPFPEPKTTLEILANLKYDRAMDDFCDEGDQQLFVNKEGRAYKSQILWASHVACNQRLTVPPLGSVPGLEKELYRNIIIVTAPRELKGTGQLQIKHWNDAEDDDKGFAYLPAFKRVIRISATTYQDNMAGSDFTWGDPSGGYLEPFKYWNFEVVGTKEMIMPNYWGPPSVKLPDGTVDTHVKWTEGKRFPQEKWVVVPVYLVESTPRIKHIYGKRTFYQLTLPYSNCWININVTDFYDSQGKLWKVYMKPGETRYIRDEPFSMMKSQHMFDLQTRHTTHLLHPIDINCGEFTPAEVTLNLLMKKGR